PPEDGLLDFHVPGVQTCALPIFPKGYSMKNWDPSETPILLLGSVFHADSLGKWIYDWTIYAHGNDSDSGALAADLWLYLIQFGEIGRAARTDRVGMSGRDEDGVE